MELTEQQIERYSRHDARLHGRDAGQIGKAAPDRQRRPPQRHEHITEA